MRAPLTRAALAAAAAAALCSQGALCEAGDAMQPIFAGAFGPGWSAAQTSYSWGGTVAAVPGRGRRGGSALCAQLRPWGGASLAALPPARPLEPAALLSFWLAPHDATKPLNLSGVQLVLTDVDDAGPMRPESAARLSRFCAGPAGCVRDAQGWTQVAVPLLEFGPWAWSRISLKVSALPACIGFSIPDSGASSHQDASGRGAAFCVDDVYSAPMLSAARWALLDDSAVAPPPPTAAVAQPSPAEATPPARSEDAARVDFWVTWERGAAALPAEGTPERDAFLKALRRDVADWLASAAPSDATAIRLKIAQVRAQEDGRLAVRFKLSMPAETEASSASRRLLDARGAVAGAASAAQKRAEAAVDSLAGAMRCNSLPAPVGPVLRALGRARISNVAVEDARTRAAAPAPASSEPEPLLEAPAEAPAASAPAPVPHDADDIVPVASAPERAEAAPRSGDAEAASPAPAPAVITKQHSAPPAVIVVVAALSSLLLALGALLCCAALAWRRRRLPQQAMVAQRAWLQGWHSAQSNYKKKIPGLELGEASHAS
jgi:hypothetical protein